MAGGGCRGCACCGAGDDETEESVVLDWMLKMYSGWGRGCDSNASRSRCAASTVASVTAVPSDHVDAEVEPVTAVWIRPRVRIAVVSVVSNYALDSLVGLLGRFAVARPVSSCS